MKKKITMIAGQLILIAMLCSACSSSDNATNTVQDSTTGSAEEETSVVWV